MAYIVQDEVHVVTEIIDLYYKISNLEAIDKIPSRLPQYGVDEESFNKKELKPINKYIDTFKMKAPYVQDRERLIYFKPLNDNLDGECLASIILKGTETYELVTYKEQIKHLDEVEIREEVARKLVCDFEDESESESYSLLVNPKTRIEYLEKQQVSLEVKWYVTLILEKPKEYLLTLIDTILESYEAYELASKHISKLKERFVKELKEKINANPQYIKELIGIDFEEQSIKLYPMMVGYGSARLRSYKDNIVTFLGCYFEYIAQLAEKNITAKSELVNIMKLLGENSKFEIIKLLGKKPMYGIEIAEKLGITAPTVSHHMNNLMIYKLVKFEKIDGKLYYVLNREKIDSVLEELRKQLLE